MKFFYFLLFLPILHAQSLFFHENLQHYEKPILKIIKQSHIRNFNAENLAVLRKKIQENKNLKIHIFGDSHIAADIFSDELRKLIFTPNAIGFTYPLFPNYHRNILLTYKSKGFELFNSLKRPYDDYPMGGIIARAQNNRAFIKIDTSLSQKKYFMRFVYKTANELATFEVTDSQKRLIHLSSKNPGFWEISKEYELTFPIQIKSLIRNGMLGGYFIYNKEDNNIIDHMGINGARSDLWLKWNQHIFGKEMQVLQYDLIILSYGSNDAIATHFDETSFLYNYKSLIRKIRRYNPNAVILLMGPPTVVNKQENQDYTITPNFIPVKKALYTLAEEENLLLFDLDELMQKTGKKEEWIKLILSKKDVHLTPQGYRLVANSVYKSLLELLKLEP
ncbi:GDSL-type esterase/lipase family protein [Helicobacter sp. faydin-H20]|uniref:GDSL-type esterase/lipase family protein n=1 Tax=Helicobacter anatolicus TaxID=2905874 RepID=UPI001E596C3A|nr:GDSL-type esterase/lipase family protein [Helicobacter anatolicus]MCE3036560.1 GDSL-type esterase/lipase family protein [Helicobacter anatolicus]